ncbi:hypothetical protein B5M09_012442, partial [Aphanomyces astaci]
TLKSNKCAKVGPNPKYSPDDIRNLVRDVPMDQRSTTRDISATTGLSRGTLSRHLKIGTFVRRSTRIKPLLTDANKAERTAFCGLAAAGEAGLPETVEFEILWDVVHLNEKWFETVEFEILWDLSYEKLESVFLTFESVMQLILEHDGGNHYVLPHLKKAALRRAGLLMQNVSCPVSLLL